MINLVCILNGLCLTLSIYSDFIHYLDEHRLIQYFIHFSNHPRHRCKNDKFITEIELAKKSYSTKENERYGQ